MNEIKFKKDIDFYEANLLKSLPRDKVNLMLHAYCMGFLDCINQTNEEFGSMVIADSVLEKINDLNQKVEKSFM